MRLLGSGMKPVTLENRVHFFAFAAQAMRRILVEHARRYDAGRRISPRDRVHLEEGREWGSVEPQASEVLAVDEAGRPAVFQTGSNALGFVGHPGFKTAMAEDLIMEFEECPDNPAPNLERLQLMVREIEDALVSLMTGIIKVTGLMQSRRRIPLKLA